MYVVPFPSKPNQSCDYTHPCFPRPCVLNRGPACRLFKDNSKLLFLLIKWLWKRQNKTYWTLITLATLSHNFFCNAFLFSWLSVTFSVSGVSFVQVRVDKSFYTIFSYRVMFHCEIVTVFVIAAGVALLVVMCWKLACMVREETLECLCIQSNHWSCSTWGAA